MVTSTLMGEECSNMKKRNSFSMVSLQQMNPLVSCQKQGLVIVANGTMTWSVRESLESRYALMHSARAHSLNPADPKTASGKNRKQWECKVGREWIKDAKINVNSS